MNQSIRTHSYHFNVGQVFDQILTVYKLRIKFTLCRSYTTIGDQGQKFCGDNIAPITCFMDICTLQSSRSNHVIIYQFPSIYLSLSISFFLSLSFSFQLSHSNVCDACVSCAEQAHETQIGLDVEQELTFIVLFRQYTIIKCVHFRSI